MSFPGDHASDQLEQHARDLLGIADAFNATAGKPGKADAIPAVLPRLEAALRVLGSSWYELAADAAPGAVKRRSTTASGNEQLGPASRPARSHEEEALLAATLQDVAANLLSCARACRSANSIATPLITERKIFIEDPEVDPNGALAHSAPATAGDR